MVPDFRFRAKTPISVLLMNALESRGVLRKASSRPNSSLLEPRQNLRTPKPIAPADATRGQLFARHELRDGLGMNVEKLGDTLGGQEFLIDRFRLMKLLPEHAANQIAGFISGH